MEAKESRVGVVSSWSALGASFLLSFATWVELANLAGFNQHWTLPVLGWTVWLSWAMGVAVDGYVVTALVAWMAPVSDEVARFAKKNTYAGAAVSVVAQATFHGFTVWTTSPRGSRVWMAVLAASVGSLPPLAGALSVHLRAMVRRSALRRATAVVPSPRPQPVDSVPVPRASPSPASPGIQVRRLSPVPSPRPPVMPPRPPVVFPKSFDADGTYAPDPIERPPVPVPPVPAPGPLRPRPRPVNAPVSPAPAWGDRARTMLADGKTVAEIYAELQAWPSQEAAKKALQRFKRMHLVDQEA